MTRGGQPPVPAGYEELRLGATLAVVRSGLARAVSDALREGTLYDYAAHQPTARAFRGRGIAYAVQLPDGATNSVVRRSRHGGLLARITGDLFSGETRAPRELSTALRLARAGIPTPEILAYAIYPAGRFLSRVDVVSREVPAARDLADLLLGDHDDSSRREVLGAAAELLARLTVVGARHPDLNLKNVLISRDANNHAEALVLDVDRVWFDEPRSDRVREANFRRLVRSARKWRDRHPVPLNEEELAWLARRAREAEILITP